MSDTKQGQFFAPVYTPKERIIQRDLAITELLGDEFIVDEEKAKASMDSAHGVVFGAHTELGDVAAKVFLRKNAGNRARDEMGMTRIVQDLGYLTLNPVTYITDPNSNNRAIYLSEYQADLRSVNTYSLEADPDEPSGKAVAKVVTSVIQTIGTLHDQALTHGDPQAKNFALHLPSSDRRPWIYDFEGSMRHGLHKDNGVVHFAKAVDKDILKFTQSIGRRQYGGESDELALIYFEETVIEPYIAALDETTCRKQLEEAVQKATQHFLGSRTDYQKRGVDPSQML